MFRILIADDHEIIRKGITQILLEEFPDAIIDTVPDTITLVEKAVSEKWDIILSDISMPGGGGIAATKQILEKNPQQRILIVSAFAEDQYAVRTFRAGAWGFVNKDKAPEELVNAIKIILSGRRYVSLSGKIVSELLQQNDLFPHELLDEVEWKILLSYASGLSISEISTQLSFSKNTIETYIQGIIKKMNLKTEEDLKKYATVHKLV
jgi:two-component system invasion response regulator UvrY